jgi:hypothetical protein
MTVEVGSIFKFTSINVWALENLRNNVIYCNHHSAFNDPFECRPLIENGFPDPATDRKRFLKVIETWGFTSAQEAVALEHYVDYMEHIGEPSIDAIIDSARISCFSKTQDNLLMWSHYADGLRGYCLEFDVASLLKGSDGNVIILDVDYAAAPKVVDAAVYNVADDQLYFHEEALLSETSEQGTKAYRDAADDALQLLSELYAAALATKPLPWKYEEETRLILHADRYDSKGEHFHYRPEAVKSIIVGERVSDSAKAALIDALRQSGISAPLKIAYRLPASYELFIR